MKNYVVYNSEGTIVSYGKCADQDLGLQASTGLNVLEAAFEPNKKVQDGVLVDDLPTNADLTNAAMQELRNRRAVLLNGTDWTQASDSPLTADRRTEWQLYRQQLRDLPADYAHVTSIDDVGWPTLPS